jgi:hypothetical protein
MYYRGKDYAGKLVSVKLTEGRNRRLLSFMIAHFITVNVYNAHLFSTIYAYTSFISISYLHYFII